MVEQGKNIKDYTHLLWAFIVANLGIYLLMLAGNSTFRILQIKEYIGTIGVKEGTIAGIAFLITFLLNGILTSEAKTMLVFWRNNNPLPGCRAFQIMEGDLRIDKKVLEEKYGKLPTEPALQNKLWYKMFKTDQFDPMVFHSHRNFLLSRDLSGLAFLFIVVYPGTTLLHNVPLPKLLVYMVFLLLQYLILVLVCRNYGNRFVCNVLARKCI